MSRVILAAFAILLAPASAHATTITLQSAGQHAILKSNSLVARIHADRPGRVTVRSTRTRRTTVRFRKAGSKRVRLRLTRSGRLALAKCSKRTLTIRAAGAFVRTSFQRDPRRCARAKDGPALILASSAKGPLVGFTLPGRYPSTGKLDAYGTKDMPADRCDPFDPSVCLQPWPNDHFTRRTPQGPRLNLDPRSMPANRSGKPIDPTDENRNDGFSPGNLIVTHIPGVDNQAAFDKAGFVPIQDIARYADPNQPAVVIDATSHTRWPVWAEMDANAAKDSDRNLIIRPARNFTEGHRYVVALRRLSVKPTDAFRSFRDGIATGITEAEDRRPAMERLFKDLAYAGIPRNDLYLAWDFTVASERSLSERALQIRDDAFKRLGDTNLQDMQPEGHAPPITLNPDTPDAPINDDSYGNTNAQQTNQDGIQDYAPCDGTTCQPGQDYWLQRQVRGQITVPCYLDQPGCPPGARFAYANTTDSKPILQPIAGNTMLANFTCNIPRAAYAKPARASLYGHGLLGSSNAEINQTQLKAFGQEHDIVFCATDWAGMSRPDLPNVFSLLTDLSDFSSVPDRTQQGYVNQLYLGRAMIVPDGLCALDAFKRPDGTCVIDTSARRIYYDGNSQGGIMGGALTALAVDHDRAAIGVPGMNFSELVRRSSDFAPFALALYDSYPNELERPLVLSLIQLLWDRGEADGYAEHMTTDPLPDTPQHRVLMHVALGDHQVTNYAADVEARTIGAATLNPPVDPNRLPEKTPLFGIPRITSFPYDGSAIVYWDSGTPPPPADEKPPEQGNDPHETPRNQKAAREQKSAFLSPGGKVIDVCGGKPCKAVDKTTRPGD